MFASSWFLVDPAGARSWFYITYVALDKHDIVPGVPRLAPCDRQHRRGAIHSDNVTASLRKDQRGLARPAGQVEHAARPRVAPCQPVERPSGQARAPAPLPDRVVDWRVCLVDRLGG